MVIHMADIAISKCSKMQKRAIHEVTDFVLNRLCPRLNDKMFISYKGIPDLLIKENVEGDADFYDYGDSKNPRDFIIRIDTTLDIKKFVETIIHELVHVKQYARGELKPINGRMNKWNKQKYDLNKIDYWETPWEIEAYGRTPGLLYNFLLQKSEWRDIIEVH
jgi:hypothetical protein